MTIEKPKRDIISVSESNVNHLSNVLDKEDFQVLKNLKSELKDTWTKKQIFRTETEMRISVLQDGKHPTNASKYWQCVREQNVFFENLMSLSFNYRKNEVKIKKLLRSIEQEQDELEKESLQIDLERQLYSKTNMELIAKDRIREINQWSKLKAEYDDGSFDTKSPNTHQAESYQLALKNRTKTLSPGSSQSEILNVVGQLNTLERLRNQGVLLSNDVTNKEKLENHYEEDTELSTSYKL